MIQPPDNRVTRRRFLRDTAVTAFVTSRIVALPPDAGVGQPVKTSLPWYRRAYLWGQTNITEKDPVRYDIAWWRAQ